MGSPNAAKINQDEIWIPQQFLEVPVDHTLPEWSFRTPQRSLQATRVELPNMTPRHF